MPRHHRLFFVALALLTQAAVVFAQGVGINGTGASADPSAMLDLSSTTKGFLPPRMTAAQRAAIVLPATGLLVYQTDAPAGLFVNAGTPLAPSWQVPGSGAAGQWTVSGADIYYNAGRVMVGTTSPVGRLTVLDANYGLRVQTNNVGSKVASFGGVGRFDIDANGIPGGRLTVLENGNLGLGLATPGNPLSFGPTLGKKISLYPDASGGDYGVGVESFRTKIYGGNAFSDVALGYDNAGTFMEKFAVKPTGALAVSGSTGTAGQVLQSNGSGAAATWASATAGSYNNTYFLVTQGMQSVSAPTTVPITGLSQTITLAGPAKVIVTVVARFYPTPCLCGDSGAYESVYVNGGFLGVAGIAQTVHNGTWATAPDVIVLSLGAGTYTIDSRAQVQGPDTMVGGSMTLQVLTP